MEGEGRMAVERAGEDGDGVIGISGGISSIIFCGCKGVGGDAEAGGGAFDIEEVGAED